MKKSLTTKILIVIAAVLLITDFILLGLGFFTVYRTVRQNYISYAQGGVEIAASLLKGIDIQKLQNDEDYATDYQSVLQTLCEANHIEYLYIYRPNATNDTITFEMVICGDNGDPLVLQQRSPGTVIPYSLTPLEQQAWNGEAGSEMEETHNQYGHVLSAYRVIEDAQGKAIALVGADVSMEETLQNIFLRYQPMVITLNVSFALVLGVLFMVLKKQVLKPVQVVNQHMKTFVSDRQAGFQPIQIKGQDELTQMAQSFNSMAQEIDQYVNNIQELTAEQERQAAEIQIAHNIQKGFLPPEHFEQANLRIEAFMQPAKEVGGDFYDYFPLSEGTFGLVIADVSGKGISAALFMAHAMTIIRQYASLGYSPAEILFHANNALCLNNAEQMFVTVFIGIYQTKTHRLVYANGGHNPPYLLGDGLVALQENPGLALGLFEEEEYEEATIAFKPGDTLFLYTDGVSEAMNPQKELFGITRLEDILKPDDQESCIHTVLEAVKEFANGAVQSDDITMLACSVSPFHLRLLANVENLGQVQHFIMDHPKIPLTLRKTLCLAVEEIFVNICSYAYEQQEGWVDLFLDVLPQAIELRFCDSGKPFDPTQNEIDLDEYDIDTQIGGLGTWIAFGSVDQVQYEYKNGQNQLTIRKFLKGDYDENYQNHR